MSAGTFEGWVPEDYFDEIVPPARATPSDWLVLGDVIRFAPAFHESGEPGRVLNEGDVVTFFSLTDYGRIRIDWKGGADFKALDPVPSGAKQFCLPFEDYLGDSVEDLLKQIAEAGDESVGELTIAAYTWSDGTPYKLRHGAFVEVSAA